MMAELIIIGVWLAFCLLLIGDWIYTRGYAKGWDDSVIYEYEKEFD